MRMVSSAVITTTKGESGAAGELAEQREAVVAGEPHVEQHAARCRRAAGAVARAASPGPPRRCRPRRGGRPARSQVRASTKRIGGLVVDDEDLAHFRLGHAPLMPVRGHWHDGSGARPRRAGLSPGRGAGRARPRAPAGAVADLDPAAVGLDDPPRDGQPEPGALRLRGGERGEEPGQHRLGDARAVVEHRDPRQRAGAGRWRSRTRAVATPVSIDDLGVRGVRPARRRRCGAG